MKVMGVPTLGKGYRINDGDIGNILRKTLGI
jgi:hypothetical protein